MRKENAGHNNPAISVQVYSQFFVGGNRRNSSKINTSTTGTMTVKKGAFVEPNVVLVSCLCLPQLYIMLPAFTFYQIVVD